MKKEELIIKKYVDRGLNSFDSNDDLDKYVEEVVNDIDDKDLKKLNKLYDKEVEIDEFEKEYLYDENSDEWFEKLDCYVDNCLDWIYEKVKNFICCYPIILDEEGE